MHEETIVYVYVPDDGVYGTIISQGAWASLIQYYEDGIEYKIEIGDYKSINTQLIDTVNIFDNFNIEGKYFNFIFPKSSI